MQEFKNLLEIADCLLGPSGCPWDRQQTFFTLQPYLLEEMHELIEAIDLEDPKKISEELGDVLYALIFIAKLGENKSLFALSEALQSVADKLVRRHPHVFSGVKVSSMEDIAKNWEEVKKKEGKKNLIDNIPPTLPALARAQKVIHKLRRVKSSIVDEEIEEGVGQKLWNFVLEADKEGIDAESELRKICLQYEKKYKKE